MKKSPISLLTVLAIVVCSVLGVFIGSAASGQANHLQETVLYESTTPVYRVANPEKNALWFRPIAAIRSDVLANGVIDPVLSLIHI